MPGDTFAQRREVLAKMLWVLLELGLEGEKSMKCVFRNTNPDDLLQKSGAVPRYI